MEQFVAFWRRRMALHGALLFVVSLLIGVVFMQAQNASFPPDLIARWRIAHMQALTHSLLLFGMGIAFKYFQLNRRFMQVAGWALLLGAWSAVAASIVSALFDVDGRSFHPDGWNRVA